MKKMWMWIGIFALVSGCGDGMAPETEVSDITVEGADTGTGDEDAGTEEEDADTEEDTGTGDEDTGDEDTGTGDAEEEPLEIVGTYTTEYGETVEISDTGWIHDAGEWGVFTWVITAFDNKNGFLIGQSDDDDNWDRFEWTRANDSLYYCQSVFDAASEEDAAEGENRADSEDLAEGCGEGFSWTELIPAD
jgi:hypothetical protein